MSPSKIAFVTSSHAPYDDRIYYHQAKSIFDTREVLIITGKEDINISGGINILGFDGYDLSKDAKIEKFNDILSEHNPDIIICSEPLPIIAAAKYRRKSKKRVKILYDITEWYPSKKNLDYSNGIGSFLLFIKLLAFNTLASCKCNGFIFGEYYKSLPYRVLFPWKKWILLGYYPDLKYINFKKPALTDNTICLGFTGKVSVEKGIDNVFNSLHHLHVKRPELKIKLKIIGSFANDSDKNHFNALIQKFKELNIEFMDWQPFEKFSEVIQDIDIFLDLRVTDFENHLCLPIKLYYYAACGRTVIYSNLKAIRKEVDISKFGHLVNPAYSGKIADIILYYVDNSDVYYNHCSYARQNAIDNYNWDKIKPTFLSFIHTFENS